MKRMLTVLLLAASLVGTGCSIIMPADRDMIHGHWLNAEAASVHVIALMTPPEGQTTVTLTAVDAKAVADWWAAEAKTWAYLDAWAKGEKPEDK